MHGSDHALRILKAARLAVSDLEETTENRLTYLLIAVDMAVVHLSMHSPGAPDDNHKGESPVAPLSCPA
jgi:hypothetical protein